MVTPSRKPVDTYYCQVTNGDGSLPNVLYMVYGWDDWQDASTECVEDYCFG